MARVALAAAVLGAVPAAGGYVDTRLDKIGDNGIRVRMVPEGRPFKEPLIGALRTGDGDPQHTVHHGGVSAVSQLQSGNLKIEVDSFGCLKAQRVSDGTVLLEAEKIRFNAQPVTFAGESAGIVFRGYPQQVYGLGHHRMRAVDMQAVSYSKSFRDSLFYGDSRGSDVSIPWYASSLGYGFLWNSPSFGNVSISADAIAWGADRNQGMIDFWITTTPYTPDAGSSVYRDLLRSYVDVVGHAAPLPAWATGFIQSKDRYRTQQQVLDVAAEYKQRDIPISMIVIDWFHWKNMGDEAFNPACYPDPQGMVDTLAAQNITLMVTLWPYQGINQSQHWDEYVTNKYLAINTSSGEPSSYWETGVRTDNALIDATNADAVAATFEHWWEGYGRYGVRAIWMDQTEPDAHVKVLGGQWRFKLGEDSEFLPAWAQLWTEGFQRGLESKGLKPGDYFILSRNAWPGTWNHGAALWSGDLPSTWESLAQSVSMGQSAGMSGIPFWTSDIGGYAGGDPASPDFQELVVRWFQFGAFCPLFRLHGHRAGGPPVDAQCAETNGDNEVWNLAKDAAHYAAILAVMRLRETLRPYVQALGGEAVDLGVPIMRPMFLEFPTDPACQTNAVLAAQYMFGPDWLVAPVTQPGASTWPVYLPALPDGYEWRYHWNNTAAAATGVVHVQVDSIGDFPLFVRLRKE